MGMLWDGRWETLPLREYFCLPYDIQLSEKADIRGVNAPNIAAIWETFWEIPRLYQTWDKIGKKLGKSWEEIGEKSGGQ